MSGTAQQAAQALGGPGGQLGGGGQGKASPQEKVQGLVAGLREVVQIISVLPGVDQAKIQQAAQLFRQAFTVLAEAAPKGGQGGGLGGAAPGMPGAPPGGGMAGAGGTAPTIPGAPPGGAAAR